MSGVAVVTGASRRDRPRLASALAGAGYAVAAVARDTGALATLERDVTAAGGAGPRAARRVTDPADVDDAWRRARGVRAGRRPGQQRRA